MGIFLPRVRRTLQGYYPDTGKQYEMPRTVDDEPACATEEEARQRLAKDLRDSVRPGDRVEIDGGSYPDVDAAAKAAPLEQSFMFD